MKFISRKLIKIDRELSDLDTFVYDFLRILDKYMDYVIVSGYVSILLGRARSSEDVDVIVPPVPKKKLEAFLKEAKNNGLYCLNARNAGEFIDNIRNNIANRLAKNDTIIPNIEMKTAKNDIEMLCLREGITIRVGDIDFHVSPLELQVAFKETVLKSPKDMEDARHIRNVAMEHLDKGMIERYKERLDGFYGEK